MRQSHARRRMAIATVISITLAGVAFSLTAIGQGSGTHSQDLSSRTEEIEWTWEVRPPHANPALPNVLLLGDSITRAYFPEVRRTLDGVANVYLMATSASIGDPRLARQLAEFASAEAVSFKIVHFNNGMHGWEYSEKDYKESFPDFLKGVRAMTPGATLIWATTTPVKKDTDKDKAAGPTNSRIAARNEIAGAAIKSDRIQIDDQHSLMLTHGALYQDDVHFTEEGAAIQGRNAAQLIQNQLAKR